MFLDSVKITICSGHGGKGAVSFRREKYIPNGGPDGGDGGKGGDIYFIGTNNLNTLSNFRGRKVYKADDGIKGGDCKKTGAGGKDIIIMVPHGTLVQTEDGKIIADICTTEKYLILKGGKGGKGNTRYKSSTHQTPLTAGLGRPGRELKISLELKLIADIGLVGKPNSGKSTLLSKISSAKPKIGDYQFTTLLPNLGIVSADEYTSFTVADIPGLIEGASVGKGLGHEFLKHIERTRILLYLIDISEENDAKETLDILQKEIKDFNPEMAKKPCFVVFNKIDTLVKDTSVRNTKKRPLLKISALKGEGLKKLIYFMKEKIDEAK